MNGLLEACNGCDAVDYVGELSESGTCSDCTAQTCEMNLDGCGHTATHGANFGAGGISYACTNCYPQADDGDPDTVAAYQPLALVPFWGA